MCLILNRTSEVAASSPHASLSSRLDRATGEEVNTHTVLFGSLLCKICYCPLAKTSHRAKHKVSLSDIIKRYRKTNYFSPLLTTLLFPFWKFLLSFLLHTYNSLQKSLVIILRDVLDTISGLSSIHKFRFFSFPPLLKHQISSYFNIWTRSSS